MDHRSPEQALAHLAAIVEFSDDAIISKTLQGIITSWNKGAQKLYGYTAEEMIGRPIATLIPEGHADEEPMILNRLKRGELIDHYETQRVRKDGGILDVSVTISPVRDASGKIIGASKIARDITERKKAASEIQRLNDMLELRIAERTAQLETANKDLEAFSYSVSHDLRAPLRNIHGFIGILREDFGDKNEERIYFDKIDGAVNYMDTLVKALLEFSRAGLVSLRQERVSMDKLVAEARQEVASEEGSHPVRWEVGALPEVRGDFALFRQVWCNLLSNAVKFSHMREKPQITIKAEDRGDQVEFAVHDNGIGFDSASADKLFGLFERLHTSNGIEGTGIGLANVRRIIDRHGGRIWAESRPGEGATFRFRLPKEKPSATDPAPA
jgi:PAS domain S-box-containing protein